MKLFIAHKVRQALQDMEARQEFTHVATPEKNAYIEAFHSIQQRELMDRFVFASYYGARRHVSRYMYWYNYVRRHGKLGGVTPAQKWAQPQANAFIRGNLVQVPDEPADSFENWTNCSPATARRKT